MMSSVFADSRLVAGYGVSNYDVPVINYGNVFSHNFFAGVDHAYAINDTDDLIVSGILSTNQRHQTTYLTELELQTSFKKQLTQKNSVAFGFHISHLLHQNIQVDQFYSDPERDIRLIGTGFGLNMAVYHQFSDEFTFNFQIHSTSYGIASSSNGFDRFTNQTVRSYISYFPQ